MKLNKSIKRKLTAVLTTGVLVVSMVGCTQKKEDQVSTLAPKHYKYL